MIGMPGPFELVVLLIIAVLLFGKRLPSLAYSAGNSIVQFKKGFKECELEVAEIENQVKTVQSELKEELKV